MNKGILKVAFISDFLPRKCGIAVFTSDLTEAVAKYAPMIDISVVSMNDRPEGYDYPERVSFQVDQNRLDEYKSAADYINMTNFEVVCVQHEFGIFGGNSGDYLLTLLRELRVPIVTTLHTVLEKPTDIQRKVFEELVRLSDKLVVMGARAVSMLQDIYGVPEEKIVFIHHGVPDMTFVDPNFHKDTFSAEGRKVILTFGLIGPSKGLENTISAMAEVVKNHPDALYVILGATHPALVREYGEEYRFGLQAMVKELGLTDNVMFVNRFVTKDELRVYLGGADICVTPYPNMAQITSGTLANYVAAGKAVVSTPYWHAEQLLSDGRGMLIEPENASAIAEAINYLLENEVERHAMRKRAYQYSREMIWPEVARKYIDTFAEVRLDRTEHPRKSVSASNIARDLTTETPKPNYAHLLLMTDSTGVISTANFTVPKRSSGYTLLDNARALGVVSYASSRLGRSEPVLPSLTVRFLSFLENVFDKKTGCFFDSMDYSRTLGKNLADERTHAAALIGLGMAAAWGTEEGVVSLATNMFIKGLSITTGFTDTQAMAMTIIGIQEYLRKFGGDSDARRAREGLAESLYDTYCKNSTPDWPWINDFAGSESAYVSQALFMAGQWMYRGELIDAGRATLNFLYEAQLTPEGHFAPFGRPDGYRKNSARAKFKQCPEDVVAMMSACFEAWHVTKEEHWLAKALTSYEWFIGRNDLGAPLCDYAGGGCRDALLADRTDLNQSAAATLAWLQALVLADEISAEQAMVFSDDKTDTEEPNID